MFKKSLLFLGAALLAVYFILLPGFRIVEGAGYYVQLYAPYDGITVNGAIQLSVKTSLGDSTGLGVDKVEYYIKKTEDQVFSLFKTYRRAGDIFTGRSVYDESAPNLYAKVWDTTLSLDGLSSGTNGNYDIYAKVYGQGGEIISSEVSSITVSNQAQAIEIPAGAITVRARQSVSSLSIYQEAIMPRLILLILPIPSIFWMVISRPAERLSRYKPPTWF